MEVCNLGKLGEIRATLSILKVISKIILTKIIIGLLIITMDLAKLPSMDLFVIKTLNKIAAAKIQILETLTGYPQPTYKDKRCSCSSNLTNMIKNALISFLVHKKRTYFSYFVSFSYVRNLQMTWEVSLQHETFSSV